MRKAKKLFLICSGISIFLVCIIFLLIILFFPLSINKTYVTIVPFEKGELEGRKGVYAAHMNDDDYQYIASDPFPSENDSDYCHVRIYSIMKNRSPFHMSVGDGYILNTEDAEFIIFKRPIAFNTNINRLSYMISDDAYELFCYRNGLSDEELLSKLRNLSMKLYYETEFQNSLTYRLNFSKLKQIDSDELDHLIHEYYH